MRISKLFTVVMLVAGVSVGAAIAKSLRNAGEPAEFPPRSYTAKQYVDSKGCVFVRAGVGGNVTWVPRISQKRQQICRQSPTFAKTRTPAVAAVAPVVKAPVAKPAPKRVLRAPAKTVVRSPAKPVVRAAVAAPAPTPRKVVRRVVNKPTIYRNPTVSAPAPVRVRVSAPTPTFAQVFVPTQPRKVVVRGTPPSLQARCKSANYYSQLYGSTSVLSARCAPQAKLAGSMINAPRTKIRRVAAPRPTRAVAIAAAPARHVDYDQKVVQIAPTVKPPKGYIAVWKDGRLNPNRAIGTAAGKAQMDMVWTATVPRRLIAVSTHQDTRRRVAVRGLRGEKRNIVVVSATSTTVITRKRQLASANITGATR